NRAAEEGSGEAAHLLAAMAASGIGLKQDWQAAFDHLARSAELAFRPAQAQLAILAGKDASDGASSGPDAWKRMRAAITLNFWPPPRGRVAFSSPRIGIAEGFAPKSVCDWLIERSRPRLERAAIVDPASGQGTYATVRTNSLAEFKLVDS